MTRCTEKCHGCATRVAIGPIADVVLYRTRTAGLRYGRHRCHPRASGTLFLFSFCESTRSLTVLLALMVCTLVILT